MIGRITGTLLLKQPPELLVDVNGIGYEVQAPMSTFFDLPATGQAVTLVTHFHVRDDAQILYGFLTEAERSLFRQLLKVNGVGAKMALAILSGMNPQEFRICVQGGDQQALVRLPGIGKKTAERLIVEMRDRVEAIEMPEGLSVAGSATARPPEDPVSEAAMALEALGYRAQEAGRMAKKAAAPGMSSEEIIRMALKGAL
jgi:Holliday junction DNA helicase RuvA